ncbi:MAG: hypothetical protein WDA75_08605 [Candidatus Latescibacterota bacterium]|jgi:hypothetical protein
MVLTRRLVDFIKLEEAGVGKANGFRTSTLLGSALLGGAILAVQEAQADGCPIGTYPPGSVPGCVDYPHDCAPLAGHINYWLGQPPQHSNLCC